MAENVDKGKEKGSIIDSLKTSIAKMSSKTKVKILLLIVVVAVVCVVYSNYFVNVDSGAVTETSSNSRYSYYVSSLDYCNELENKLKKVLSNMEGIGNVEVMITLESSMELVFANTNENSSDSIFVSDSDTIEASSPIIIETNGNEEPLVVKEVLPEIKGVLVVCSGADNLKKLDIIYAIKSLLDINISNIQVLSN